MTGYISSFFRHDCGTRGCYVRQLPSWDDLIECFPRNIRPTDVDGMVEINDHFLFLEEKGACKSLDRGQRKALQKLASRPRVTVVFFRPTDLSDLELLVMDGSPPRGWEPYTRDEFRQWLRDWALKADVLPRAS